MNFRYEIKDNKVTILGLIDECVKSLFIPDFIKDLPVTKIDKEAFFYNDNIEIVTMSNNIKSIGKSAFRHCTNLKEVTLSQNVKVIDKYTFADCYSLKYIDLPENLTNIVEGAFAECENLTRIILPDTLKSIDREVFADCIKLKKIDIPDSVINIGDYAFLNCLKLREIYFGKKLKYVGENILCGCPEITKIITNEDNKFYYSGSFNAVIKKENNELIIGCKNTIIPGGVTSIADMAFDFCKMKNLFIPKSVLHIGDRIFATCNELESIVVEEGNPVYYSSNDCNCIVQSTINTLILGCKNTIIPTNVTKIGYYAFSNCHFEKSLFIPDNIKYIDKYAFEYFKCKEYNIYNNGCYLGNENNKYILFVKPVSNKITKCDINQDTKFIAYSPFNSCKKLKKISLPRDAENLESLLTENNTDDIKYNIYDNGCYLGNEENKYLLLVTTINKEIENCKIHHQTKYIGDYAFVDCENLKDIKITENITTIGSYAFCGCSLTNIFIPKRIKNIGEDAFCCSTIERIIVDNENKIFDSRNDCNAITETASNKIIRGCKNTIIPKEITIIGKYCFANCEELFNLNIPNSIRVIEDSAFYHCPNLVELNLPDNLNYIGDFAFFECYGLKKINIPYNIKFIGQDCFWCCENLIVYFYASKPEYYNREIAFGRNWRENLRKVIWNYFNKNK